eukprot:TRINITY_DN21950_c0_g1_i2.p1 TRINITY_DN21950_c0_g1~~TRINITY_DN21950_c0_g1_i2.p1  ORF type:complete len:918 (+),score=221.19 TRINITY_DN21950_c0_g1_i2:97-2850(+)
MLRSLVGSEMCIRDSVHAVVIMSDRIYDTAEYTEVQFGEALDARTAEHRSYSGLGPPDMCFLEKLFRRSLPMVGSTDTTQAGYYHWVAGVDCSSAAGVAGYFGELIRLQEDETFVLGGQWVITHGTFAIWCPISRVDLRVDLSVPGGIESYAVGPEGERFEPTEALWQEAHVASLLRRLSPPPFASLKQLDLPVELLDDSDTRASIKSRFLGGTTSTDMRVCEQFTEHEVSEIRKLLVGHFFDFSRFSQAASFFAELAQADALLVVPLVAALRSMEAGEEARKIATKALREHPGTVELQLAMCDICLDEDDLETALEHARRAVQCDRSRCASWLKLVQIYVKAQNYDLALIGLNVMPEPEEARPSRVLGVPKTAAGKTEPKMKLRPTEDPEQWLQDQVEEPAEPGSDILQRELPAAQFRGMEMEVYKLLVAMYNDLGWDQLLRIRSEIFLMQEDVTTELTEAAAAEPGSLEPGYATGLDSVELGGSEAGVVARGSGTGPPSMGGDQEWVQSLGPEDLALMEELTSNPPPHVLEALRIEHRALPEPEPELESEEEIGDSVGAAEVARHLNPMALNPAQIQQQEALGLGLQIEPSQIQESDAELRERSSSFALQLGDRDRTSSFSARLQSNIDGRSRTSSFATKLEKEWEQPKTDADSSFSRNLATASKSANLESSFAQRLGELPVADEIVQEVLAAATESGAVSEGESTSVSSSPDLRPKTLYVQEIDTSVSLEHEQPDPEAPKRLCTPFMDALFRALYSDVHMFSQWMIQDEEAKAIGHMHGKNRPRSDWLQLGMLGERLHQLQEAETGYRCCVRTRFDHMVWERLMQLYATGHYVTEALVCAIQLCNYHIMRLSTGAEKALPPENVQKVMCGLVAVHGLTKVRTAIQLTSPNGACPQMIPNMVALIRKHKCHGFNC